MKYIGFSLLEVKGAPGTGYNYEVVEYSVHGVREHKIVTMAQLNRDWGSEFRALPENGAQYGMMQQGEVYSLDAVEFAERLVQWKLKVAA